MERQMIHAVCVEPLVDVQQNLKSAVAFFEHIIKSYVFVLITRTLVGKYSWKAISVVFSAVFYVRCLELRKSLLFMCLVTLFLKIASAFNSSAVWTGFYVLLNVPMFTNVISRHCWTFGLISLRSRLSSYKGFVNIAFYIDLNVNISFYIYCF